LYQGSPPAPRSGSTVCNCTPEAVIQAQIVSYLDSINVDPFTATLGGVYCSRSQRKKILQLGYKKGVPDLVIFVPRGIYHGLLLEVKSLRGRVSAEQKRWHTSLENNGYFVAIPRSFEQAKELIHLYLSLDMKQISESAENDIKLDRSV
jgi:hypothetical protein